MEHSFLTPATILRIGKPARYSEGAELWRTVFRAYRQSAMLSAALSFVWAQKLRRTPHR
jgi:hypothetical protein